MNSSDLLFTPLGGLGEIGMNMMVLESASDALIIDCGVMFPDSRDYGVDLILPDFSYLEKIKHKIRALLLTHGHEDHIGAVPNQKIKLGVFSVEFLQVTHSIVDGMGLAIHTPQGTVIHTADFKIDSGSYRGKKITLQKFQEYGKRGVTLLLSDSTNVEHQGKSLSEEQIHQELEKICRKAPGRIIFSVFATNIRRMEQVLQIALKFKRRVVLLGRSIETNVPIAVDQGFIGAKEASALIDMQDIDEVHPEQLMVICTGSQAEEHSALWRMSQGEHKHIRISKGDWVILSSKFIPGNEKAISRLINNLYRRGAEVFYEKVANVHISGHAYAQELRQMIEAVKPRFFIPVHGEYRHLVRHNQLAQSLKISPHHIFVCENGDRILFSNGKAQRLEPLEFHPILIQSEGKGHLETEVLKERRQLSQTGVVCIIKTGEGLHIYSRGVLGELENKSMTKRLKEHLLKFLKNTKSSGLELQEELRLQTRRFFKEELGIKPVVLPVLLEGR
ncbi:MAG: ribonuclease J [Deltaproteobacteria bacterium]|nr:ribonuclease J [Deltaproteobacteria bacterium]